MQLQSNLLADVCLYRLEIKRGDEPEQWSLTFAHLHSNLYVDL